MASFVFEWLVYNTAQYHFGKNCSTADDCEAKGESCLAGECIAGITVHTHDALSPAFEYNTNEGKMNLVDTSPEWPMWTEA